MKEGRKKKEIKNPKRNNKMEDRKLWRKNVRQRK
jgi:hypothetical protein